MQLLFERSHPGRGCTILPACDDINLDASLCRAQAPHLPQLSENEISRHYTELANKLMVSMMVFIRLAPAP